MNKDFWRKINHGREGDYEVIYKAEESRVGIGDAPNWAPPETTPPYP